MSVHVQAIPIEGRNSKYGIVNAYDFVNSHTNQQIATGAYNRLGIFEVLFENGDAKAYKSAAAAWTKINDYLISEYNY